MNQQWFGKAALFCGLFFLLSLPGFQFISMLFWGSLSAGFGYLWYLQYEHEERKRQAQLEKAREQQYLIRSFQHQDSSGEWLTDPVLVKEVIEALWQLPVEEVQDFKRYLYYKMPTFIRRIGMVNIRAGFIEAYEVCLQRINPALDPGEAHQEALKEFESFR